MFVLRKINSTKTAASRAALFDSNMHQTVCRLGLRPRPYWGSFTALPHPIAVFRGLILKGGEGVRPLPYEEKRKVDACEQKLRVYSFIQQSNFSFSHTNSECTKYEKYEY